MLLMLSDAVEWDYGRWPNFAPRELACTCRACGGEIYYDEQAQDAIQTVRNLVGRPIKINSGHRCIAHNRLVGGVTQSQHLTIAFDVDLDGHDKEKLLTAAIRAGFTGLGFYITFMHMDLGRKRHWFGGGHSPQIWLPILSKVGF